jgi:acetolactate synthase-1/3 small subunit
MQLHPEPVERHVLSVVVDNEAGILARVAGLFTARGYNIDSLAVAVSEDPAISGMTIVTSASSHVLEQIIAQLDRLIPVHSVLNLTAQAGFVERELALVRFSGDADNMEEATRIAEDHSARIIATAGLTLVIELTGQSISINSLISRLRAVGDVEAARTGVVAVAGTALRSSTD